MAVERKIYCQCCDTYVGTLRDAKLMKNLAFVCPTCSSEHLPNDFDSDDSWLGSALDSKSNDFMDLFSDILNGKKK